MPITVYARREPTKSPDALALERAVPGSTKGLTDVAIYRDAECTAPMARFSPAHTGRPRSNSKLVRINCWNWALQWAPALH